ncbi:hypothetical protein LEMLEM_LOCUS1106 [Lemmus lemmus]
MGWARGQPYAASLHKNVSSIALWNSRKQSLSRGHVQIGEPAFGVQMARRPLPPEMSSWK